MPGIYLHIPFCRRACAYCDFHFSTRTQGLPAFVSALIREAELRAGLLPAVAEIETVYFGGGTPSLLNASQFMRIWEALARHYNLAAVREVTLEANPDDLTPEYLRALRNTPINRLSIGIQSFRDEELQWMRRAHTAAQAQHCVPMAQDAGFESITIDLIYATPSLTLPLWQQTLDQAVALGVGHISAYALTVEPGTALGNWVRDGRMTPVPEENFAAQFRLLSEYLTGQGFVHYEISNLARPGHQAIHNTNYWQGVPYVGLGPSASGFAFGSYELAVMSYELSAETSQNPNSQLPTPNSTRYSNIADNAAYVSRVMTGQLPTGTEEHLTAAEVFNEWVMTGLRQLGGIARAELLARATGFGAQARAETEAHLRQFAACEWLIDHPTHVALTLEGRLVADYIAAELFQSAP